MGQQNSYFSDNIKQFGEDFLRQKNSRQLEMDANRVFRDLARGKVDIEKYGEYFLDRSFLKSLNVTAMEKYNYYNISYSGVYVLMQTNPQAAQNPIVSGILEKHNRSRQAYGFILNALASIERTNNYNYLFSLASQIRQFRFDL